MPLSLRKIECVVGSAAEAERMVGQLVERCGCSRADITLAAQGPQSELTGRGTTGERSGAHGGTVITVHAKSDEAAQCAKQILGGRTPRAAKNRAGNSSYGGPERRKRKMSFSGLERRVAMQ
jgi:hypothetical protein